MKPRKYSCHNDRKNQRKSGRKECRRRNTYLPMSNSDKCNFYFFIGFDCNGFFVKPGVGCCSHNGHTKLCSSIISNINKDELKFIKDMGDGHTKPSTIQNTILSKYGKFVPRSRIRYLTEYHQRSICNSTDYDGLFDGEKSWNKVILNL